MFRNPLTCPHFVVACNTHGVWLQDKAHCVHAGIGRIRLGIVPEPTERNFEASLSDLSNPRLSLDDISTPENDLERKFLSLRNTIYALTCMEPLNVTWEPIYDVDMARRKKLVVNSIINPLTALLGCRNGDLFTSEHGRHICTAVCYEVSYAFRKQWESEVCAAAGVKSLEEIPEQDRQPFPYGLRVHALIKECRRVAEITASNYSSMLVDIKKGQPTEIDELSGYLLSLGRRYRCNMYHTRMLFELIKLRQQIPLAS